MSEFLPAITIWQPHASLITIGAKRFETRDYPTSYRGPVAVHAGRDTTALREMDDNINICKHWSSRDWTTYVRSDPYGAFLYFSTQYLLQAGYRKTTQLPLGAVLCIAHLKGCHRAPVIRDGLSDSERAFGGYEGANRWAWELDVIQVFPVSIPARGQRATPPRYLWDWRVPEGVEIGGAA